MSKSSMESSSSTRYRSLHRPAPAPKPVREAGPARTGMQWLEIIILAIVLIGLIWLFAKGISTSANGDVTQCAKQLDPKSPVGMLLALVELSGFAIGRAVAKPL